MSDKPEPTWAETIKPITRKCRLSAQMGLANPSVTFRGDGAEALARVLEEMARIIDDEIVARRKGELS